jgi:hypothetical protein
MRRRDPHDDPPTRRRPQSYQGAARHARAYSLAWRPALADLLFARALLPSQLSHQRRPLAGRDRASGPGPEGGLHQVRDNRRGRAAELERTTAFGEPDRHTVALSEAGWEGMSWQIPRKSLYGFINSFKRQGKKADTSGIQVEYTQYLPTRGPKERIVTIYEECLSKLTPGGRATLDLIVKEMLAELGITR